VEFNNYNLITNEIITKEMIQGEWHSGDKRKESLTKARYDYEEKQKIVNRILILKEKGGWY